jgi:DNA-directed RNA polymerase subunit M/transcription elongation factor TFIIS
MKCPKCKNLMQYVFRVDDKFFYCFKCEIRREGEPPKIKAETYEKRK